MNSRPKPNHRPRWRRRRSNRPKGGCQAASQALGCRLCGPAEGFVTGAGSAAKQARHDAVVRNVPRPHLGRGEWGVAGLRGPKAAGGGDEGPVWETPDARFGVPVPKSKNSAALPPLTRTGAAAARTVNARNRIRMEPPPKNAPHTSICGDSQAAHRIGSVSREWMPNGLRGPSHEEPDTTRHHPHFVDAEISGRLGYHLAGGGSDDVPSLRWSARLLGGRH